MIDKDKFCIAPFVQIVSRADGEAIPCCYYMKPESNTKLNGIHKEWKDFDNIRQTMLDGTKTDPMCQLKCYDREKAGSTSERLGLIGIFDLDYDNDPWQQLKDRGWNQLDFPKKVELHTSNLCNLKCLTCHPRDSSSFLTESIQIRSKYKIDIQGFGDEDLVPARYQYTDAQLAKLLDDILEQDIEILDLRGGETMMVPYIHERLLALPLHRRQKISIRVQTNGTYLTDQWLEILETFKNPKVQFSIDATGDDIHYIRYPANWNNIESNLAIVKKMHHIDLTVSCVVSNLNFPILDRFITWAERENHNWGISTVSTPEIFQPNNLPEKILQHSISKLSVIQFNDRLHKGLVQTINYLCSQAPLNDEKLWAKFCETISLRDAHRKNSIFDIHPYLREYWIDTPLLSIK